MLQNLKIVINLIAKYSKIKKIIEFSGQTKFLKLKKM